MPTPGQMHTFLVVIETGSVRAAADRLVVSQPAVSSALAALQRARLPARRRARLPNGSA
ncbi:MAG: helix-turn-helix domain-containing protein [Vulcanimicrobiaceae bacterium]